MTLGEAAQLFLTDADPFSYRMEINFYLYNYPWLPTLCSIKNNMVNFAHKRLQVFVSSTFTDLIHERQAAVEAILVSGNFPAGMELFTSGDESQMDAIKQWIDESDIYMLILGGRYGSIEPKSGKSYTHLVSAP